MSYLDRAKKLNKMIFEGQLLEAFEKYYHDDVVMTEPTGTSCPEKLPTGHESSNL